MLYGLMLLYLYMSHQFFCSRKEPGMRLLTTICGSLILTETCKLSADIVIIGCYLINLQTPILSAFHLEIMDNNLYCIPLALKICDL